MKNRHWTALNAQDTIEIIAPASASPIDKLHRGEAWLKNLQLNPSYPEDIINTDLFFAAPLEKQWEHFKNALFSDSKILWCLRGGYGCMRLLPLLDNIQPPKVPKLLIGFSDVTSLHLYFNQKWNWPTLHGRTISQLDPDWEFNQEHQDLINILFGSKRELEFNNLIALNEAARIPRTIQSTVTGGNLRLIQSSLATPWQIETKGKILFIEDVSERGYSVDRMLEQMYEANILKQELAALVIGDFSDGLEKNGENLVPLALERFAQRVNYPVLKGMPCGHKTGVNPPLPFNTPSRLVLGRENKLICETGVYSMRELP